MFDLTKEVILEGKWKKRYVFARLFLFLVFIAIAAYFAHAILFPSQNFTLDLSAPESKGNNFYYEGHQQGSDFYSAYSRENFSAVKLQFILKKESAPLQPVTVSIRKTYQAFIYPTAANPAAMPSAASESNAFANGTLLSFANAVFIVVDGKVMPFNNPLTFLSFGYQWNDVIPATEAEAGLYQRDKLFTVDQPHPDGTVFLTRDSHKYFLVQNKQKLEISNPDVLKPYLKNSPIAVDEKSLDFDFSCQLKKDLWPLNSFSCALPTEALAQFLGNDYQFKVTSMDTAGVSRISANFTRSVNLDNMRNTLSDLKQRILLRYGATISQ